MTHQPTTARTVEDVIRLSTMQAAEARQLAETEADVQAERMRDVSGNVAARVSGARAVEALTSLSVALPCLAAVVAWTEATSGMYAAQQLVNHLAEFDTFMREHGANLQSWEHAGHGGAPHMLALLEGYFSVGGE